ncbi:uncharacterized protein [Parasteatoda tepidariorum]|uniref:uncharacterized protein n=1 Tax=Parasteatoda tepidariorum TaxID=114398 RepID=UPI000A2C003C|nr:uncharacterized protein LOC107448913 [Parasteatoda tepidariorum]
MPKSKRNKQIELSKTKKHGLEGKKKLYEEIQSCLETYTHLFIFTVNDMRNSKIKTVREQWKHSRFFIGKNKVMAKALGLGPEDEFRMNLHKVGQRLKGERGLLFSNQSIEEVLKWFRSYSESDFARSGNRATETVVLQEGPLNQFPHNLEPYLRQLGLPTTLKKGVIHLVKDHTVCNVGDVLTPETAKIVKLLGYEMAEFYIKIECVWSQDGSFSDLTTGEELKENIDQSNSASLPVQTPIDVASMDVDEVVEPSDEMIENIIMKNRRSRAENKLKQLDNEASPDESSDGEEVAEFDGLKTADKEASLETSNELSADKIEKVINTSTTEIISRSSFDKDKINVVEDVKITNDAVSDDENEEVAESIKDANALTDEIENESSEEEDIPELVPDGSVASDEVNTHNMDKINEIFLPNGSDNSFKRLSLDKSVLQSPVLQEKRRYSPKMTRSAMKAKKVVSKIDSGKANVNDELNSLKEEVGEMKPAKGQSKKMHSTGESPIERTLRNRSIKIVKK